MSRKMAKSTSQRDFSGTSGMHYMANLLTTAFDEMSEDLFYDYHLDLQERMQNSTAFHADMIGDIMYYDQALQQPDAKQCTTAVLKEVKMDMSTTSTGHYSSKRMFQKRHKLYLLSGQCGASMTSPQTRLSSTKPG